MQHHNQLGTSSSSLHCSQSQREVTAVDRSAIAPHLAQYENRYTSSAASALASNDEWPGTWEISRPPPPQPASIDSAPISRYACCLCARASNIPPRNYSEFKVSGCRANRLVAPLGSVPRSRSRE